MHPLSSAAEARAAIDIFSIFFKIIDFVNVAHIIAFRNLFYMLILFINHLSVFVFMLILFIKCFIVFDFYLCRFF